MIKTYLLECFPDCRAWSASNELAPGQLKVDDKSNEITAIPLPLKLLDIEGSMLTIDAMGTFASIGAGKQTALVA